MKNNAPKIANYFTQRQNQLTFIQLFLQLQYNSVWGLEVLYMHHSSFC